MIVEFSVKNFRSIKDLQTISFVATGLKSPEKYAAIDKNNIVEQDGMKLFKTLGIYGANASGKSNVLFALTHFVDIVRSEPSSKSNILGLLFQPFFFIKDSLSTEVFIQTVLILEGVKYRYGLTVALKNGDINRSEFIIKNEWLYGKKEKNMRLLFKRDKQEIENKMTNGNLIPNSLPYNHSLFVSHAAAFDNNGICKKIKDYFYYAFSNSILGTSTVLREFSIEFLKWNSDFGKQEFLSILSMFNLNYEDIEIQENENTGTHDSAKKIYLEKKNISSNVQVNLDIHESEGTKKMFNLVGLLLASFSNEYTPLIMLDEIDSHFHPSLVIKLVTLFNDPKINKSNAQLLFTSHDTNLMSPSIMRRDQFYFTEKNEDDSTRLYSLADLKGIRNDADFARQYLAGYYGAVPVLKDYVAPEFVEND